MKLSKWDLVPLVLLFVSICIFFLPLFYPTPKLYSTAGYSTSDILHFNFPIKILLSQALKNHTLPIWTDMIGSGFPLIGESQIQSFSIINLILFSLFSTVTAFNLGYVINFMILAFGTYLVGKQAGFSKIVSFLTAFIFTFSGYFIVRFQHYNILPAFCYIPLIYFLARRMISDRKSRTWIFLPILISQSILSGHLQIAFYSLIFFSLLGVLWWVFYKPKNIPKDLILRCFIIITFSVGLSAIQLIPTYEFFSQSSRGGLVNIFGLRTRGLDLRNIAQFFVPYGFGDIRMGTYHITINEQNFWESLNYIGIIPLLLAISSIVFIHKHKFIKIFWILIAVIFFLSLEGNSPLAIIYTVPPLSMFRAYTRFLVYAFLLLAILSGFIIEIIRKYFRKKFILQTIITVGIAAVSIFDVWRFAQSYNPVVATDTVFQPPQTAQYLQKNHPQRIYSLDSEIIWNQTFSKYGWKYPDRFVYLLNMLNPNVNVTFGIPQSSVYSGLLLNKQYMTDSLIHQNMDVDSAANTASLSATGTTMLNFLSVDYFISPYTMTNPTLKHELTVKSPYADVPSVNIYKNPDAKPLYYISHNPIRAETVFEGLTDTLNSSTGSFDAIVEGSPGGGVRKNSRDVITRLLYTDMEKTFAYTSNTPGYFILSTYKYPGWTATIDGKPAPILSGNLYAMAVAAPKGTHTISFKFIPASLYTGAAITAFFSVLYAGFIIAEVNTLLWRNRISRSSS